MAQNPSPSDRAVAAAHGIQQKTVDLVSAVLAPKDLGDMAHVSPARQLDYYRTTFGRPDGQLNGAAIAKELARVGEAGYKDIVATMLRDAERQGYPVGKNRANAAR